MSINQRFRKIRESAGLSQNDFAKKLNAEQSRISDIERGRIKPGLNIMEKLYNDFQINMNWLICGKGKMKIFGYNVGDDLLNEPNEEYISEKINLYKKLCDSKDEVIREKDKHITILENKIKELNP